METKSGTLESDWVAVERAVVGDPPEVLTHADRKEIIAILHARGLSDPEMVARTGISKRTVLRIRQGLGLPPLAVNGHG